MREAAVLLLLPGIVYLAACLLSYSPGDPGWSHADSAGPIQNLGGAVGAWIADIGLYFLGAAAYLIPLLALMGGWRVVHRRRTAGDEATHEGPMRLAGSALLLASTSALCWLHFGNSGSSLPHGAAGVFGDQLGHLLSGAFGALGASLMMIALLMVSASLATGISWFKVMDGVGQLAIDAVAAFGKFKKESGERLSARQMRVEREVVLKQEVRKQAAREPIRIETPPAPVERSERAARELQIPLFAALPEGSLPPLSLLDEPKAAPKGYSPETLEALSRQVELKLKDFRIEA